MKRVLKKVLVIGDKMEEIIHYIEGGFATSYKTLCGKEHLCPTNTVHIHTLDVTCEKCLRLAGKITKKRPKTRRYLSPDNIARMINDWPEKTLVDWAKEFKIGYQAVSKTVSIIRDEDKTLCSISVKGRRETRAEIAKRGLDLYYKRRNSKKRVTTHKKEEIQSIWK